MSEPSSAEIRVVWQLLILWFLVGILCVLLRGGY